MIQAIEQMHLATRLPALKEMVLSARAQKEAAAKAEAEYLDMLAKAEAQVLGGEGKDEGVELTGLIADGENPYHQPAPAEHTGDEPKRKR